MYYRKKGISPLIATVLLIGFTVTMAAFVSTFVIKQTRERFNPENLIDDSSLCDQMVLGVEVDKTRLGILNGTANSNEPVRLTGVFIKNKGAYAMRGFVIATKNNSVEIPYIFDKRVGNLSHKDLRQNLKFSDDNLENYVAPGEVYYFGDVVTAPSVGHTTNTGIPLLSNFWNYDYKIRVYPIIYDFETEKGVRCVKSTLTFNYRDICENNGKPKMPCCRSSTDTNTAICPTDL